MDNMSFNHVPELKLDGGSEELQTIPTNANQNLELEEEKSAENILNEEEKQMVQEFAQKIDVTNSNMVLLYGAEAQKNVTSFSEVALNKVRTKDVGEVSDMLTGLVAELKGFSFEEQPEKKGLKKIFKKSNNAVQSFKLRYDSVEKNIQRVSDSLEKHKMQLMKDIAMLDQMYDVNLAYYKELTMYILAGKEKLKELEEIELTQLRQKAVTSGLPEDAQAVNDLENMCNRFEKKLHDLELTRTISMQMAPQIRLLQNNDSILTEKIQSTLVNTIPLWKNQMVLGLGLEHSKMAMEAQRSVTDMTNEMLKKNADMLKQGTVETAKEAERGIVDIETLEHTNQSLISTLDEVLVIQQEGRKKRSEAEGKLQQIENELKNKMLESRGR